MRTAQHYRVGRFIDPITHEELTAQADYVYTGPASVQGRVRHLALIALRAGCDVVLALVRR